jgi:hypothetical protein
VVRARGLESINRPSSHWIPVVASAEDLGKWTAAAVYRGTNGSVQAFFGGSERMATTTSYRLFSKDRDVFYDGYGPQRDYTVTVPGGTPVTKSASLMLREL